MVAVDAAYLGDAVEGGALLAALDKIDGAVVDKRAVLPVANLADITAEPTDPAPAMARAELVGELRVSGRKPYTFLAAGERAAYAFDEGTLARLRELKRARDPQGVFRANFPVSA
ncbi:hypothetical protein [Nonomuraea sp. NPDC003201]